MDLISPSSPLVERNVCTTPPALFTMSELVGDSRSLPDVRSCSAPTVARDEESKKETLKYFLDWLRCNNLTKTEKCLLTEIEDEVTTPATECAEPNEGVTFEAEMESAKAEVVEEKVEESEEVKEVDSWENPDDPGFIRILARPGDEFYELWSEEVGRAYFAQHGTMPPFEGKADNVPPPQSVPCDEAYYRQFCSQQQWDATAYAAYQQQQQPQQPAAVQQQQQQYQQQLQQQMAYAAYYAAQQQPGHYDYSKDPMAAYYSQVQQQQQQQQLLQQQQQATMKYPTQAYVEALPQQQVLPEIEHASAQHLQSQSVQPPQSPQSAPVTKQIDIVTVDATQDADVPATNSEDDESRNISMDVTEVSASDVSTLALAEIEAQIQTAGSSVQSTPNTPLSSLLGQQLRAQFGGEAAAQQQQQPAQVHAPYDQPHAAYPEGVVMEHYPNLTEAAKPVKEPVFEAFELKVIYETGRTGFEEHKDYPIRTHAVIAGRYQVLEYLGAAAFSRAVQCVDLKTGQLVCIKIIRNSKDFFDQSLDEIKLLQYINSRGDPDEKCVLQLYDYFYHKEHLFLVCELLRDNLYEFSKYNRETGDEPYFTIPRLQKISKQVLTALEFVHSLNLIHCDLKPENILIKSYSRCEVKVIDFGSSCYLTDHLSSYVQSRCYRAPEVVLGLPYNNKIDLWSLGCILAELFTGRVLFQNDSISTMMVRIIAICGDLPEKILRKAKYGYRFYTKRGLMFEKHPKSGQLCYLYPKRTKLRHRLQTDDEMFLDFVTQLLQLDSDKRPSATEALQHPFLKHEYGPISYN